MLAVGARPPPTLLTSTHKQQLPGAGIHARLHPSLLPHKAAMDSISGTDIAPGSQTSHSDPIVTTSPR